MWVVPGYKAGRRVSLAESGLVVVAAVEEVVEWDRVVVEASRKHRVAHNWDPWTRY